MAGLEDALRGKRQKFSPFLQDDYKGTFSNCQNMFVSRLCELVKLDSDEAYQLTVTEKMDGVALLLSFTYKRVEMTTYNHLLSEGKLVNFAQEKCDTLNFTNTVQRQLFFRTMLHMWAEPWKYFSGRIINGEYFVFLVQLWAPTHNEMPLLVPHILRQSIEDKLCNVLKEHWDTVKDLTFDNSQLLLYRCEFVVGSYGPNAAASMIARWKTVAQEKRKKDSIIMARAASSSSSGKKSTTTVTKQGQVTTPTTTSMIGKYLPKNKIHQETTAQDDNNNGSTAAADLSLPPIIANKQKVPPPTKTKFGDFSGW